MKKCVFWLAVSFFCIENVSDYWSILHLRGYVYIIMVNIFHKETFFSAERDQHRDTVLFPFFNAFCLLYNGYSSIVVAAFFYSFYQFWCFLCVLFYYAVNCHHIPSSIACTTHFAWHTCTLARLHTCTMALYPTASRLGVIGSRDSFKCINVRFIRYKSMLRVANICIHEYFE